MKASPGPHAPERVGISRRAGRAPAPGGQPAADRPSPQSIG
jgi:hypothetical protein